MWTAAALSMALETGTVPCSWARPNRELLTLNAMIVTSPINLFTGLPRPVPTPPGNRRTLCILVNTPHTNFVLHMSCLLVKGESPVRMKRASKPRAGVAREQ